MEHRGGRGLDEEVERRAEDHGVHGRGCLLVKLVAGEKKNEGSCLGNVRNWNSKDASDRLRLEFGGRVRDTVEMRELSLKFQWPHRPAAAAVALPHTELPHQ